MIKALLGMTIGECFDRTCLQYADHDAVVSMHQNIRLSYAALQQQVEAFACSLMALGFAKGDRLAIWSFNSVEWTITQFAAAKAGIILVNLNPAYKAAELEYVLNKVSCKGIVIAPRFKTTDYHAILTQLAPELALTTAPTANKVLRSKRLPHLQYVITMDDTVYAGVHHFSDLTSAPSIEQRQQLHAVAAQLKSDQVISIQFTSGTTGSPKATMLSHHNILNNGYFSGKTMHLRADDRVCIAVPLFHCFAMVVGNLTCMTHGATMIYPSTGFAPLAVLNTVQQEKCTALYGVPTMFIAILEHPQFDQFDLSSLRTGVMGGSLCPREVMQRVIDRMHMQEVTICYGMTELSPTCTQTSIYDTLDARVNSVGRVHPHLEIKIINTEGHTVPHGELGELCVRGYSVMLCYWEDTDKTAEVIDAENWMHTGDIAEMDAHGFIKIKGRIKDVVIRGGENLYPKEIEDFLYTHPNVSDVQVVGLPDARYGEELCACIILHDQHQSDHAHIREFCKEHLARNKVPKYVHFLEAFPMTASGKAQKFKLRELMCEELNLMNEFS